LIYLTFLLFAGILFTFQRTLQGESFRMNPSTHFVRSG